MSRPKQENKRDIIFKIRLNDEEYRMLDMVSEQNGKPKSKVIREALAHYYEVTGLAKTLI